MCNLYSVTKGQKAILELARAMVDRTGNMPPLPGIFPDYGAPVVREGRDGRELVLARWGMPSPLYALKGKKTNAGVTNIRNAASPHWRRWLWPESRCLVPFTSFTCPPFALALRSDSRRQSVGCHPCDTASRSAAKGSYLSSPGDRRNITRLDR